MSVKAAVAALLSIDSICQYNYLVDNIENSAMVEDYFEQICH